MPKHELVALEGVQMPMVMQKLEGLCIGWQVILAYSTKNR